MTAAAEAPLSLYHLLDPEVLANPYPLYRRLREEDPVHWDPYPTCLGRHPLRGRRRTFCTDFSADRTPSPEQLAALGMES